MGGAAVRARPSRRNRACRFPSKKSQSAAATSGAPITRSPCRRCRRVLAAVSRASRTASARTAATIAAAKWSSPSSQPVLVTSVALCFPGQGSQAAGMADGLADQPIAAEMLAAATDAGLDLGAALAGDDDSLRATDIAQPELLLVESTLRSALPSDLHVIAVAGHSVGEYAAAVAAGALHPADAMRLVIERGRSMAAMHDGTMCALIGIDLDAASAVCEAAQRETGAVVVVANHNAPGQLVISGSRVGVDAAAALALTRGARRAIPLNVGGAFHSPLMARAAAQFAGVLDSVPIADPDPPVVCNVDARAVHSAAELRDQLRKQLTAPVRWIECVQRLVDLGAEALIEVGPGNVLSGLARRVAPGVRAVAVTTPAASRELDLGMVAR